MRILCLLLVAACSHAAPRPDTAPESPDRDLARSAEATLHRDDPDKGPPAAAALAKEHGGWVASMNEDRIALRVPDAQLDAVLAALPSLGEVAERRVRAEDTTDAHRDLQVRIDNLRKTRDRYLSLLDKAAGVSEATAVEHELERVTVQLELLEAKLQAMEGRIQYAQLSLEFSRKVRPGPVGWVFYAMYSAAKWLLVWN